MISPSNIAVLHLETDTCTQADYLCVSQSAPAHWNASSHSLACVRSGLVEENPICAATHTKTERRDSNESLHCDTLFLRKGNVTAKFMLNPPFHRTNLFIYLYFSRSICSMNGFSRNFNTCLVPGCYYNTQIDAVFMISILQPEYLMIIMIMYL